MEKNKTIWEMAMENAKKEQKSVQPKADKINLSKEIILAFSTQKSFISSKKIERFVVFITFIILTVVYISRNIEDLQASDFIQVIGIWLAYGGYNSFMIYRDKGIPQNETPPVESVEPEQPTS